MRGLSISRQSARGFGVSPSLLWQVFAEPNEAEEEQREPEPAIEKQKSIDRAGKLYLPEPLARANRTEFRQATILY